MLSSKHKALTFTSSVYLISLLTLVFSFDWVLFALGISLGWLLFGIGLQSSLHNYYSHKTFKLKYDWLEYPMMFLATIVGVGGIIPFTAYHRVHHGKSDKEGDPHSPELMIEKDGWIKGWLRVIFFHFEGIELRASKVKDLLRKDIYKKQQKYYYHIHILYALTLAMINPIYVGYFWALPIAYSYFGLIILNGFEHTKFWRKYIGYTNFETGDYTSNSYIAAVLCPGGGNHNNHHMNPSSACNAYKKNEFDLAFWFIKLVGKDIKVIKEH